MNSLCEWYFFLMMDKREGSERIWSKTLGVDRGQAKLYLLLPHIRMYGEKICWGQSKVYAQAISLSGCSLPFLCLSIPWIKCSSSEGFRETVVRFITSEHGCWNQDCFLGKGETKGPLLWTSKASLMVPEKDTRVSGDHFLEVLWTM